MLVPDLKVINCLRSVYGTTKWLYYVPRQHFSCRSQLARGGSKSSSSRSSPSNRRGGAKHSTKKLRNTTRNEGTKESSTGLGPLAHAMPNIRQEASTNDLVTMIRERVMGLEKFNPDVITTETTMQNQYSIFSKEVDNSLQLWVDERYEGPPPSLFNSLRQAYIDYGLPGLDAQIGFAFQARVANWNFSESDFLNQAKLADLRYPVEWYPGARSKHRTIHLHIGPTNSGKTYAALQRLEQAESGVYAGPLRLLAHEVFARLNAKGKSCNLITGDERQIQDEGSKLTSCTVEMVSLNNEVDVAVIDEIQMIGDIRRGWAWTRGLLGIRAKELHICGEERVMPLIKELAIAMGDKLEIHKYQRLNPLRTMSTSLRGELKDLRKGDCVVTFSRLLIHELKRDIERVTKKRVAIIYGSLPPEIRAHQARLFNDPTNDYDILVASDAIGMGLNLSIKRIIFERVWKHNGRERVILGISDTKQIAGRAGRYRTAAQAQDSIESDRSDTNLDVVKPKDKLANSPASNLGLVTCLNREDLPIVKQAMQSEAPPLTSAGIFPPDSILLRFAKYFPPNTPFSYILLRLHELSRLHSRFHLCDLFDQIDIADLVQPVKGLSTMDRIQFCSAPMPLKEPGFDVIVRAYAKCVAEQRNGSLLDISQLNLEILDAPITRDRAYLQKLETMHKALVLYLWLSYRFAGIFSSRPMAFYVKGLFEEKIEQVLSELRWDKKGRAQTSLHELKQQARAQEVEKHHVRLAGAKTTSWGRIAQPSFVPDLKPSHKFLVHAGL